MKVLSLFDGMRCGMIAMTQAGLSVSQYDAYEIDKYAVETSSHNFPSINHHGDVFEADFTKYHGYDFLVGGSPCQHWSIAQHKDKRELTASGIGWDLFSQYLRALHDAQPKYFIYENNNSMSKAIRQQITQCFGFEPILINSSLVSAQNRQRLYWVGKRNEDGSYSKVAIDQPQDKGLILKDILESGLPITTRENEKSGTLTASYYKVGVNPFSKFGCENDRPRVAIPICLNSQSGRGGVPGLQPSLQDRIYSIEGKHTAVTTAFMPKVATAPTTDKVFHVENGHMMVKGQPYPIKLADGDYTIRKLTVKECMRLQTIPDWYEFPTSNSQAYKMLGNGWTTEVIAHLIKACIES